MPVGHYGRNMTTHPRAALDRLVAALEAHLSASEHRRGERDPAVEAAYRTLADAFETYDDALYDAHGEVTPFELYDDQEDDREDADEDDDSDDSDDEEEDDGESDGVDDYEVEPRGSDTSSRA